MKLISKLLPRKDCRGYKEKWGIFKCNVCLQEKEMRLSNGYKAKSCGCDKIKHGESKTRLYNIWRGVLKRCLNSKNKDYPNYGGRGITICPKWSESYIEFRDWALVNGYNDSLTIDRINNDGNYEPSNCEWILKKENSKKRRTTKLTLEIANEIRELHKIDKFTQLKLAKKFGVAQQTISQVIKNMIWIG